MELDEVTRRPAGFRAQCRPRLLPLRERDPTLALSLSRQRHADLVAEAHQEQLVEEALDYAASRMQPREHTARGRDGSRRTAVLTGLWRTMGFAVGKL